MNAPNTTSWTTPLLVAGPPVQPQAMAIMARLIRRCRSSIVRTPVGPPATAPGDRAERVVLEALLAGLAPTRREAFVLTQILGLDHQETARVLGCPIGTVRPRVARARADLLAALRGSAADGSAPTLSIVTEAGSAGAASGPLTAGGAGRSRSRSPGHHG